MRRSRTGDWSVVIGPGPTVPFFYIFSFSSLVRVVANLRRCLHYHINNNGLSLQTSISHKEVFKINASEAVKRPATELIPAISKVLYKD